MSYVLHMIAEGEHQHQDFKMRVDDARKIAKTMVAYANTSGGRMLIGVRDNGAVCGCRAEEEYHMIEAAAELHSRPSIPFEVQVWKAEGRTILEVQVPRSAARPHFCEDKQGKWLSFLRKDDKNIKANPVLIKVWQYEMRKDRSEFRYDQYVGKLFAAWRSGRTLQFRHVARIARLPYSDAEDLLCLLIVWGIVRIEPGPKGFTYSLGDVEALEKLETHGPETFRWQTERFWD